MCKHTALFDMVLNMDGLGGGRVSVGWGYYLFTAELSHIHWDMMSQ